MNGCKLVAGSAPKALTMADLKDGQLAVALPGGNCEAGTVLHCNGVNVIPIGKTRGLQYTVEFNSNPVRLLTKGETIVVQ